MKVSNQTMATNSPTIETALELKQGETHRATVKERLGGQEAILNVRGKDVHVRFEGNVPKNDRVTIQVTNQQGEVAEVRSLAESTRSTSAPSPDINQVLRNLGAGRETSPELREAVRLLLDRGILVNKEVFQDIRNFIEREKGSWQQKLETIQALLDKRLPLSQSYLRSVHEALHGRSLEQALSDLTKELATRLAEQVRAGHQGQGGQGRELEARLLAERLVDQFLSESSRSSNQQSSAAALTSSGQGGGIVALQAALQFLHKEADLSNALTQIQGQLSGESSLGREMLTQLDRALREAGNLAQQGRELAAREHLHQALNQALQREQTLQEGSAQVSNQAALMAEQSQYMLNEEFQTSQHLSTQDLLVTRVTQKLAQAAQDFSTLKREVSKGLDQTIRLIQQLKNHALPQARQMLATTIDKLDKAILKNELMMLTDMKTEKQLMQASSQLAQARNLLAKGEFLTAQQMVHDVKNLLDKLRWQPSETRVQHFLLKESQSLEQGRPSHNLMTQFEEGSRSFLRPEASARQMFELLRGLGLNHESDTARALLQQASGQQDAVRQLNMKTILLQLLRAEAEQSRVQQQAEQALNNLTGQQLLSRNDPGNPLPSLFFNIPFMLEDNLRNLQVIVKSRQEGEKLDWENCSIYFLIETKKLGEIGILLAATDRNLSITIKNDSPGFKEKMEPLVEECLENLAGIGYNIMGIYFTKLEKQVEKQREQTSEGLAQPNVDPQLIPKRSVTAKGFDLKI